MLGGAVASVPLALLLPAMAFLELLGAWLVWRSVRDGGGLVSAFAGITALALYAAVAALAPTGFGRTFAAYGGVFVAASLAWGWRMGALQPDPRDFAGLALCLAGSALIAAR